MLYVYDQLQIMVLVYDHVCEYNYHHIGQNMKEGMQVEQQTWITMLFPFEHQFFRNISI